ncbi:hypothetical protein [Desulfofalx alkaliphila]|uniref:hypothetical protein n=1 Tax=Desulfofalx alkaliphila TaxID=105483 RepID=UPI0004E21947|nr:hypothetical protein [Desulfofalx alkaliphila]
MPNNCPMCYEVLDGQYCASCCKHYCPICQGMMELGERDFSQAQFVRGDIEVDRVVQNVLYCPKCEVVEHDAEEVYSGDESRAPF